MKKKIIVFCSVAVIAAVLGAAGMYKFTADRSHAKVLEVEAEATSLKETLLGFTKYTDYVSAGKQQLTGQTKFLAAKVVREYDLVEQLQAGHFGLKSSAAVQVHFGVEYSFGYDLSPSNFDLKATPGGLEVKVGKPILVATPAVINPTHTILSKGIMTDEKAAVIGINERLPKFAQDKGVAMAQEEAVRALCEKQLVAFLRDFLGKQPGVKVVPAITVVYK